MTKNNRTSIHFDRKLKQFVGITDAIKTELRETFKGVNVDQELSKMSLWLQSDKGQRRKGHIGFVWNWLSNVHPSLSDQIPLKSDSPLGILYAEYVQSLWKNREHILESNTLR